nr:tetratricopeptide repeat protein [Ornithinimicrobium sp. F0845]
MLVEGLVAAFDQVNASSQPLWVALEAPSGWGKTRVAREFYAQLAARRQHTPPYWPPTILGSRPDLAVDDVSARRKRVYPHVRHVPNSLPAYLWWGIAASVRNGIPTFALAEDIGQLEAHAPYLDDAWARLARWSERHGDWWRQPLSAVGQETVSELSGRIVESLAGFAVPGLGLVGTALGALRSARADARERRDRLSGAEEITAATYDIVDEACDLLTRLGRPGLPVVLFVEDLHAADDVLAELLERLVVSAAAVLIVTTAWPGHVAGRPRVLAALARDPSRVIRVDHETTAAAAPFPPGASLGPLGTAELGAIIRHYYPAAEAATVGMLVERYRNPLAIELFCLLDRYRTRFAAGDLRLPRSEVDRLPETVRDLYRHLWRELPEASRRGLTLAGLAIPTNRGGALLADPVWHNPLVLEAVAVLGTGAASEEVSAALTSSPATRAWARPLGASLRQFHEDDQWRVAVADDEFFWESDRDAFLTALAEALTAATEHARWDTPEDRAHAAQLAIGLRGRGLLADDALARAVQGAVDDLWASPRELPSIVRLTAAALEHLDATAPAALVLRRAHACARDDLGEHRDAADLLHTLLADCAHVHGESHPTTLNVRNRLANATRSAGRPEEALLIYQGNLTDQLRVLGEDHRAVRTTRNNLANAYLEVGRVDDALPLLEDAVEASTRADGPLDVYTLQLRNNLAAAYGRAGRDEDELTLLEATVDDMTVGLGAKHPSLLNARLNLASAYGDRDQVGVAIRRLEELVPDLEQFLGDRHPTTFKARNVLGGMYRADDRVEEALDLHSRLYDATVETFGLEHPLAAVMLNDLAITQFTAGDHDQALALFERCLDDRRKLLGTDHPDSLTTESNLARTLIAMGHTERALGLLEPLLTRMAAVHGPDSSRLLDLREHAALAYDSAGRADDARRQAAELVRARARVQGALHPDTVVALDWLLNHLVAGSDLEELVSWRAWHVERVGEAYGVTARETITARQELAYAHQLAGAQEEATAYAEQTLALCLDALGADDEQTLVSRNLLANTLFGAQQYARAGALYALNLEEWRRVAGEDASGTLAAMHNLALCREHEDDRAAARRGYSAAAEGRARVLGEDDPDTLASRVGAASVLADSRQTVAELEPVLARAVEILGSTHETTRWARRRLIAAYRDLDEDERATALETADAGS